MNRSVGVLWPLFMKVCDEYELDHMLVGAFVCVESSGNRWAWNPEPAYRWLWDVRLQRNFRPLTAEENASNLPPRDFPTPALADRDAEFNGQRSSWGLMQVMGAVAREYGFAKPFLTELCDPFTNLQYGCKHLQKKLRSYAGASIDSAIAAYNAGSARKTPNGLYVNQTYVERVKAQLGRLKDGTDVLVGEVS